MRQQFLLLLIILLFAEKTFSQSTLPSANENSIALENKITHQSLAEVANKTGFIGNFEVTHHPYFSDIFKYADIKLARGRAFLNVRTRIDIENQQATFISSNGIEIPIEPGLAKEITFADTTKEGIVLYKFKTGFPNIDKLTTIYFYLVLVDGRCNLLKSIVKRGKEKGVVVFSEYERDYETITEYYLFSKGIMKRLKRDKDFILSELADKQEAVSQFLLANKTNFNNDEQMIRLLNYYNSLEVK